MSRGPVVAIACLAVLLWAAAASPAAAQSGTPIREMAATHPVQFRFGYATAWANGYAYVFGGTTFGTVTGSADAWRYDPVADTLTPIAPLPLPLYGSGAAYDGTYVYLLGGLGGVATITTDGLPTVMRFDPATETAVLLPDVLPEAGAGPAVWDGTAVYFFPSPGWGRAVVRYDPATGTAVRTAARTPSEWPGAIATPHGIFYAGGHSLTAGDELWRFDPALESFVQVATFPGWTGYSGLMWDGTLLYAKAEDGLHLYTYDPVTSAVGTYWSTLPAASWRIHTVSVGSNAYMFGAGAGDRVYCLRCPLAAPAPPPPPPPVAPPPPPASPLVADFGATGQDCQAPVATFQDASAGGVPPYSWSWEFGDGATSLEQHPTHAYPEPGTYQARLSVTDRLGATAVAARQVQVPSIDCRPPTTQEPQEGSRPPQAPRDGHDANAATGDQDRDGVADGSDLCPAAPDPAQRDLDGDGLGDACDPDRDGDGVADREDACPGVADPAQRDADRDGLGDPCDPAALPVPLPVSLPCVPGLDMAGDGTPDACGIAGADGVQGGAGPGGAGAPTPLGVRAPAAAPARAPPGFLVPAAAAAAGIALAVLIARRLR